MKKLLIAEIIMLLILLVTALVVCIGVPLGAFAPEEAPKTTESTGSLSTQEPQSSGTTQPEETTEPAPTWMTLPEDYVLTAEQAFVYDCETESYVNLIGSKDDRVYPASITKLFTAYVALQYLNPDTQITAGDALDMVGAGSSVAEIEKGDTLSVARLVEAMLLPSGNDASYILAAEVGRIICNDPSAGAWYAASEFVDEMNDQAAKLGMTGTHFTNPDGYHDDEHYTTYADLVTMAKLALENPTIMQYAAVSADTVTFQRSAETGSTEETGDGTVEKQWKNTNALIDESSQYYCPYAIGLKTGQTPSAGSCLLSAFRVEGKDIIIGVFGCPEVEDRFADTLQLLNEALATK